MNLLNYVPNSVEIIVAIVFGNDWYSLSKRVSNNICEAAKTFAEALKNKAQNALAVIGGSANLWRYDKTMSIQDQNCFDFNSQRIENCFNEQGVSTCSGALQLAGIEFVDSIGHVHISSHA